MASSRRHSKVEFASVEVKLKLGEALFEGSLGLAVMFVSGAMVSTVQV